MAGETGRDFEQAAEEVKAPPLQPEVPPEARPQEEGAPVQEKETLEIKPEWAAFAVKASFIPLEKLDHPSWKLSDEEAERVSPKLIVFLQAFADRYIPEIIARLANRNEELLALIAAYGALLIMKGKYVRTVKKAEAEEKARQAGKTIDISSGPGPSDSQIPDDPIVCETCGDTFKNRLELAGHLPCKGKGPVQ